MKKRTLRPARVEDVIPEGHIAVSSGGRWEGFFAGLHRHPPYGFEEVAFGEHVVSLVLGPKPFRVFHRKDGQSGERTYGRGDATINPAGCPESMRWDGEAHVLNVHLGQGFVRGVAGSLEADPDGAEIVPVFRTRDPKVERLGLLLKDELETGGLGGELYAQGLANAMAVHLLREHSSLGHKARRRTARETKPGGLSHRALKRATDYVGDNLSGELSLDEVASAAGYSRRHFSRAFKESTGLSPHQYVIRQRVERAKGLLLGTDLPVGEVARACGFAHQSHLAHHFRRAYGVSPTALRKG